MLKVEHIRLKILSDLVALKRLKEDRILKQGKTANQISEERDVRAGHTNLMIEREPGVHESQKSFDEFKFLFLLNFLQHQDVIHGGGIKGPPLHVQNGIRFLRRKKTH